MNRLCFNLNAKLLIMPEFFSPNGIPNLSFPLVSLETLFRLVGKKVEHTTIIFGNKNKELFIVFDLNQTITIDSSLQCNLLFNLVNNYVCFSTFSLLLYGIVKFPTVENIVYTFDIGTRVFFYLHC